MVLSYKTLSNKLLRNFVSINKWMPAVQQGTKQTVSLRQISSIVQPNFKDSITQRKLTLSEYLKNILENTEHRSGFAQVLNSKIDNLKSNTLETSSTEGFKNYLLNNKTKNISQHVDIFSKNSDNITTHLKEQNNKSVTAAQCAGKVEEYSNLVLSQLTELSYFTQFSGLRGLQSASKITNISD